VELHHEVIEESDKRPHRGGMLLSGGRIPDRDAQSCNQRRDTSRGRDRSRTKAGRRTR
jgi:hypothetical protein